MKKIVFSGGGTLGHILPNIVLANSLKNMYEVYYIGEKNSMEEKQAKLNNIPFYEIEAIKLNRYKKLENIKIPFVLPKSISKCKKILQEIKPDLVFTKGGYVSLPVVVASKMLNIPQICHESDYSLGIVNKIAYKLGAELLTSFSSGISFGKRVGIPLKDELFLGKNSSKNKENNQTTNRNFIGNNSKGNLENNSTEKLQNNGKNSSKIDENFANKNCPKLEKINSNIIDANEQKPDNFDRKLSNKNSNSNGKKTVAKILVTGGSLGAKFLNDFILDNIEKLPYKFTIIGGNTIDTTKKIKNVTIIKSTNHMEDYYNNCDIVIARAGATTIAEIIALNKKAILVPLPKTVSRGDQLQNANVVKGKTIKVIPQEQLDVGVLVENIENLQKVTVREKEFVNPKDEIIKIIEEKMKN